MTFRVGQMVEKFEAGEDPGISPIKIGDRVRVIFIRPSLRWPGELVLAFDGVAMLHRAKRFRPIVERETDISALKALLVPGAKIREDA